MANQDDCFRFALHYKGLLNLPEIGETWMGGEYFMKGSMTFDETMLKGVGQFEGLIWGEALVHDLIRVRESFDNQPMVTASDTIPYEHLLAMLGEVSIGTAPSYEQQMLHRKLRNTGPQPELLKDRKELHEALDQRIDTLNLSTRNYNIFINRDFLYVGQLVEKPEHDFTSQRIHNFGRVGLTELKAKIKERYLRLGMDTQGWVPPNHPSRTGTQA